MLQGDKSLSEEPIWIRLKSFASPIKPLTNFVVTRVNTNVRTMAHANIKYQFWSTCTVEVSIPREEHTDSLIPLNSTSRFPTNTLADIPALPAAYAKIMPSHGLYPH